MVINVTKEQAVELLTLVRWRRMQPDLAQLFLTPADARKLEHLNELKKLLEDTLNSHTIK